MLKRLFAILLALAMLLSVTAVFAEGEAEEETAPAAVPDTLLVTVNGEEIRQNDETLQYYYTSLLSELDNPEEGNPDDEMALQVARMYAMSYAVQLRLISQKSAGLLTEEDIEGLKESVRAEWNDIVDQFMADSGITEESSEEDKIAARADVLSYLEIVYGYNEEKYVTEGLQNLIVSATIDKVAGSLKEADPTLAASEEEILQLYNEYVAEEMEYIGNDVYTYEMYQMFGYSFHYIPEGYRGITHILLSVDQELLDTWTDLSNRLEESKAAAEAGEDGETPAEPAEDGETPAEPAEDGETPAEPAEDGEAAAEPADEEPVTEEMVEAARQAIIASQQDKIDEIMKKLEEGAVFEDLIAEYGTDPGMELEENLRNGYTVHPESINFVPEFTAGVAALEKVGDVSEPVVSSLGIHILHYLRDIEGGGLEMTDEIRETLREEIESERVNLAVSEEIDRWQAEADIVWTEEGKAWIFDQAVIDAFNAARAAQAAQDAAESEEGEAPAETEGTEEPAEAVETEGAAETEEAAEPEEAAETEEATEAAQ